MIERVTKFEVTKLFLAALMVSAALFAFGAQSRFRSAPEESEKNYLGFDRNIYPGDDALPILRKTFAFSSYWLSPPPGEKSNTWTRKRELLRSRGFGFVVLYQGPGSRELKTQTSAKARGTRDGEDAAASAKTEGFSAGTIIFLDIEEGGRLPDTYHAYLAAWSEALSQAGFRPGAYCSGMPVKEEPGVTITTAEDIRNHAATRGISIWAYNDACPPSPGCTFARDPASPAKSGIPYSAVWQFAQSPRRKEFTSRCAATYHRNGNCYAPGDSAHSWFLDVNSATSPDPSGGAK
jgi:hypothetical protein